MIKQYVWGNTKDPKDLHDKVQVIAHGSQVNIANENQTVDTWGN